MEIVASRARTLKKLLINFLIFVIFRMNKDSFFTKKYTDIFDISDVPEQESKEIAWDETDWVIPSQSNTKSNSIARGG